MILNFIPRPPVIEAQQFVGDFEEKLEVVNWVAETLPQIDPQLPFDTPGWYWSVDQRFTIRTWVGITTVDDGDWVLKDGSGNFTSLGQQEFNRSWMEQK